MQIFIVQIHENIFLLLLYYHLLQSPLIHDYDRILILLYIILASLVTVLQRYFLHLLTFEEIIFVDHFLLF